jgi:hypothetical protein
MIDRNHQINLIQKFQIQSVKVKTEVSNLMDYVKTQPKTIHAVKLEQSLEYFNSAMSEFIQHVEALQPCDVSSSADAIANTYLRMIMELSRHLLADLLLIRKYVEKTNNQAKILLFLDSMDKELAVIQSYTAYLLHLINGDWKDNVGVLVYAFPECEFQTDIQPKNEK